MLLVRILWKRRLVFVLLALVVGLSLAGARGIGGEAVEPVRIDRPLLAHWTFDECFGSRSRDASGNGCDASPAAGRAQGLERTQGVFGSAIAFAGSHLLQAPERPAFGAMDALSLSAWVQPTELGEYREIFRKEDGDNRVLFSFQNDGTILSLGLNIGGYVECDARIDPKQVLDGEWHHCAATFDGKAMRVFLDGEEIGSLERPGRIAAGGPAPACIGSSNGGECFQGEMDDLRIYSQALAVEEVARLERNGRDALAGRDQALPADEPRPEKPLVAHWTFNERGPAVLAHDATGAGHDANAGRRLSRARGVHGSALDLAADQSLSVPLRWPAGVSKVALSAWVRPTNLAGFREILRQECGERVLFSFQENGTVLSLGLNVGGYEECDAAVDPARLLDGAWHHCAGTFDGKEMRVFLDGKEVGSLRRPGRLALPSGVPAFLGSSSGLGEFLRGSLDDVRVYADALSPEEVADLHGAGLAALDRFARSLERSVQAVFTPAGTFAETLAGCRRRIAERRVLVDRDLGDALLRKVQAHFPAECAQFREFTGVSPLEYLAVPDDAFDAREAGRLVALLLEYRPLTEHQRRKQTPTDAARWEEAGRLQGRLEALQARGDAARFSPDWIALMLEAGRRVQFRPAVHEAVAPYVRPETPRTRTLSAAEARASLERDWLHQADNNPTPERIRAEIGWARALAARISARPMGPIGPIQPILLLLEKQAAALKAPDKALYFRVREVKRRILFSNPAVDFDKVLFVDMPYPQGSEWTHETRHRLGYMAVPGARLLVLEGLGPDGRLRQLMPQAPLHGSFWRPDLSWDARKVLFCFKPHNEKSFHLYEIGLDGKGLTQLTDGPYDDLDPIYLPDGRHLLFSTTRAHTYVRCMPPTNAFVLARSDRDGKNVYLVSTNNEPDYLPSAMPDGRVIYTRWEYTDKPLWRAQGLWTVNPDGTHVSTFWGNQSVWPDLLKDARAIPGSRRVMFTGSAHHNWFAGSVGIVDPERGFNFPDGLAKVTADVPWPESGNGPVDPVESPRYHRSGVYGAYYSPYPLSERDFLVSAQRGGKFVLYLMDVDGNRELIYEGAHNILHALPIRTRRRPPVLPERVAWPAREARQHPRDGVLFSSNVTQNAPAELRGRARFLRILSIDPKTYTYWYQRPYISTGPVVSAVQSEGVKRILGTVPIEADGSVAFHAPAGKSLHFQLLDERGRALQTMRSFVGVMPGEYRGCLGCHESHSRSPERGQPAVALRGEPKRITPPPWGEDTVSYPRYVQPVLDRYCASCHGGNGPARKVLDLTERPSAPVFTEPYLTLIGRPAWGQAYQRPADPPPGFGSAGMLMVEAFDQRDPAAYKTPKPMSALSYRSRLIEIASGGRHHGVKVDPLSLARLTAWVDAMCPYLGDEEIRRIPDPVFQGVDWLAIRPRIRTAPVVVRPGPVD